MNKAIALGVLIYLVCCFGFSAWVLTGSGLNRTPCILLQQTTTTDITEAAVPNLKPPQLVPTSEPISYGADPASRQTILLGSQDKESDYFYELELTSLGAAIRQATFSRFPDRDHKNPQPLVFLSPADQTNGPQITSLANRGLVLVDAKQSLPLDKLDWELVSREGKHSARFAATITTNTNQPVLRLEKTFTIRPESYLMDCQISIENLSADTVGFYMNLTGPTGPGQEAFRQDMRKTMAAYRDTQGQVIVPKKAKADMRRLNKATTLVDRQLRPEQSVSTLLWTATTNKYFAGILVPLPESEGQAVDWIAHMAGALYTSSQGETTLGLELQTTPAKLQPAGQANHKREYRFELFLGPKDKSMFDKDEHFNKLGFAYVIDFIGCCCPAALIRPLAFFIMALMKGMFAVIHNYGVVIIILVFLMRLAMHPVTKKSQISMHKMSKLAPRAEEIKKKYANNKTELNKQLMELYREQGASPIMGFLPMMLQMPIWIALWSSVNSSIDLRGAAFLPFWITDLSVPDALIRFPTLTLPLLGWKIHSLNVLPLLMGVAFYLQQKLMPTQAAAASNPQMAQQQKMMMIMMPIMFPLMLYNVPSGVNLYIMTSTFAGVLEQHIIRKHIREKEAMESVGLVSVTSKTGGKKKKKKPKPMYKNLR